MYGILNFGKFNLGFYLPCTECVLKYALFRRSFLYSKSHAFKPISKQKAKIREDFKQRRSSFILGNLQSIASPKRDLLPMNEI